HRCRRFLPRRRTRHRQARKSAPADPEDESAVFVRDRRERRPAPAGSEERAARGVCESRPSCGDRGVPGDQARLVSARLAGLPPRAGGEGLGPDAGVVQERIRVTVSRVVLTTAPATARPAAIHNVRPGAAMSYARNRTATMTAPSVWPVRRAALSMPPAA